MRKIMYAVTISKSLNLMEGQFEFLKNKDYEVQIVSSRGKELKSLSKIFKTHSLKMEREIKVLKDIYSLINAIKIIKKEKPDLINYSTPKASLIFALASFINKTPNRIYTIRGLRYETTSGFKKILLKTIEKVIVKLSTDIVTISNSMRIKLKKDKIVVNEPIVIFGNGSSNGLKEKYKQVNINTEQINKLKNEIKKEGYFIVGFVGRLHKDKGVYEIIKLIEEIDFNRNRIKFLLIGDFESIGIENKIKQLCNSYPNNIIHKLRTDEIEYYYNLMDVLLFPTHREGFGNVSIEAQSQGVPVITTNATGSVDTISSGRTGLLTEIGDWELMKSHIMNLYNNPQLLKKMSYNAKEEVLEKYDSEIIWQELSIFYSDLLEDKNVK